MPRNPRFIRLVAALSASLAAAILLPVIVAAQPPAGSNTSQSGAAPKPLTLDALFHPDKKLDFSGGMRSTPVWLDDTTFVIPPGARRGSAAANADATTDGRLDRVNAISGKIEPWFDPTPLATALARVPGITADEARRLARPRLPGFNPTRTALVLTVGDDLYYFDVASSRLTRLSSTPGIEEEPTFSPDGKLVAFLHENNLHIADVATGVERALTTDGSLKAGSERLNGKLDWVYQEEIYGRGTYRAFWWSPDSTRLAFLQLDESPVPEFTVVDHLPYRQTLETYEYPKAGDPNPKVKLGVVRVTGGEPTWVDTEGYGGGEHLIVDVTWSPDSRAVVYQVQDREQTWLDLNSAPIGNGGSGGEMSAPKRLLRETSKAWVNRVDDNVAWLKDGSFLWFSERTGFRHLYHYKADGTLIRQVTDGRWEVRTLHGVDATSGWVYFSGTERSPIGSDIYRIKLDGSGLKRLSETPGTHTARFNPSFTHYFDDWSDAATPPQLRLHAADGAAVRVVDEGRVPLLAEYRLSKPEFLQVKARDGFELEAMIIKPPDFDPSRKYPVFQQTYAGPHSQTVRNSWSGTNGLYFQLLAQKGVIVWECDNRTASGKGVESTWPLYRNFGESELRDIEDCVSWLKKQPWVDASRIGINGWSYGGFMVSYTLTHSKSFTMGIAGGTVADWRDYDSVYTERYMGMPQNNPEGYRKSSPRWAAKDLTGRLFLIHGLTDDNVHVQNTMQFAYELQKASKPFELMVYPKSRHGIADPWLVYHMRGMMLDFTLRTLTPAGGAVAPSTATASR
jgi:dipeptidyl-peptidase-4